MHKKYIKQYKIHGHKNCKIGTPLGIHNKNGIEIHSGDKILWNGRECIVLYRFAHKKNNIRNNYGWVGWFINMLLYIVAFCVASKYNDQIGCIVFITCLIFIFGMF